MVREDALVSRPACLAVRMFDRLYVALFSIRLDQRSTHRQQLLDAPFAFSVFFPCCLLPLAQPTTLDQLYSPPLLPLSTTQALCTETGPLVHSTVAAVV
jgi:hypothetical protein